VGTLWEVCSPCPCDGVRGLTARSSFRLVNATADNMQQIMNGNGVAQHTGDMAGHTRWSGHGGCTYYLRVRGPYANDVGKLSSQTNYGTWDIAMTALIGQDLSMRIAIAAQDKLTACSCESVGTSSSKTAVAACFITASALRELR
jgi:hypothetical protein